MAMNLHGVSSALLILGALIVSALIVPAATSFAQGPAFDGKYVGTATVAGGKYPLTCVTVSSMNMTITGGQVVVHEIRVSGADLTFQGSVNAVGGSIGLPLTTRYSVWNHPR
jgi:hypothetical protein